MRTINRVWLASLVIAAAGCAATTAFTTTWRNPDTKPLSFAGQKVVALVISTHEATRRTAEDTLAAQITALGVQGVPAWTILPTADVQNEDRARVAIASAGAAAIVIMEIVAQDRQSSSSNVQVGLGWSNRGSFWPHYRHAWQVAWSPAPASRSNVWVETHVHTLEPDELIWAGRSRTANADSAPDLFAEVASAAAREVERAGLLKISSGPSRQVKEGT